MGKFTNKYRSLSQEVRSRVEQLIDKKGVESDNISGRVLKVKNDDLQFNLAGGRYLTEIGREVLIDNSGYQYGFDVLTLEELCEVVDSFVK